MNKMPAVETYGLTKVFGTKVAVDRLDLRPQGDHVRSGCVVVSHGCCQCCHG